MPVTRSQTAHMEQPTSSPTNSIPENEENYQEITEWEFDGIVYLMDKDNFLYDTFTHENIGYFDGEKVLYMEENGVWVEEKTEIDIIPKEEVDKHYSEKDLLNLQIKQQERELNTLKEQLSLKIKELTNKERYIQQQENVRISLVEKVAERDQAYTELATKYTSMKNSEETTINVLENSGAFDQESEPESNTVSNDPSGFDTSLPLPSTILQTEVERKENVIRRKDAKATRLITIIREKNLELLNIQNYQTQTTLYNQMLSSNIKVLTDENLSWRQYYYGNSTTTGQIPTNTTNMVQPMDQPTIYMNPHYNPQTPTPIAEQEALVNDYSWPGTNE
jgi:hypothetical protein